MTFGERVRSIRLSRGETPRQVTERTDFTQINKLYYTETGMNPNPSLRTVMMLARAFDMTVDELLEGVDMPPQQTARRRAKLAPEHTPDRLARKEAFLNRAKAKTPFEELL